MKIIRSNEFDNDTKTKISEIFVDVFFNGLNIFQRIKINLLEPLAICLILMFLYCCNRW